MSQEHMPQAPPQGPSHYQRPPTSGGDGFFKSIRNTGLFRSDDRWIGGVAGGLAERFGWDPLLVRGILFVSFFISGIGLIAYGLAWALLPEQRDGRIHLQQAIGGNFNGALVGAGVAVVSGLGWAGGVNTLFRGPWRFIAGGFSLLFWAAAISVIVWLVSRSSAKAKARGGVHPVSPATPPPVTPPLAPPTAAPPASPPASPYAPPSAYQSTASLKDEIRAQADEAAASAATQQRPYYGPPGADAATLSAQAKADAKQAKKAAKSKKPKVISAGPAATGVVAGLLLLAGAIIAAISRTNWSPSWMGTIADPALLWLGAGLIIVGAAIALAGFRGRTSGFLGFLAIVGLIISVPWALAVSGSDWLGSGGSGYEWVHPERGRTVSGFVTARSIEEAEAGYRANFGDVTIDLASLDLDEIHGDRIFVPIRMTAGDIRVIVPRDVPVEADIRLWAGEVRWDVDGARRRYTRIGTGTAFLQSDEAIDGETPVIHLMILHRFGTIRIEEN